MRDAVLRLDGLPVAMETFSALPGRPATECMRMASEADALVCIVAHRYGYVPPIDLGGDGERSITWLEVDAAQRARKPVFAFLVDPKAPWPHVKEQDRMTSEPEKATDILKAVKKLQEFRLYLENECMRNTFSSPEELAKLVAIALANFATGHQQDPKSASLVWKPLFCHALQPARHFRGRMANLELLTNWLQSPATPHRVVSLVAAGGTGKTALVERVLREATFSGRAGLFVWSFYEEPNTDAFLRAACLYFTDAKEAHMGGMLERLQLALSDDSPHVLVLDGLERVQREGDPGRRGELEDFQLKRLMRGLAGGPGNARALVTSRFPLLDLDPWVDSGHQRILLDDLEHYVGVEVLRAWKVRGDDAQLARALGPLDIRGSYHALSVAVLGSYIANFADGDPSRAPVFSLKEAEESDIKAARLHRILEEYAHALQPVERDLLTRLSLFPRGVAIEFLGLIVQSGGKVGGALSDLSDRQLLTHLERLIALGVVFRYKKDKQTVYSAHPFLRDFFRNLLGTKPAVFHEAIRTRLAPSLAAKPKEIPRDPAILDQYELLIEQTRLAGHPADAFDLYKEGMGAYQNLGIALGDNVRGLRILEGFVPSTGYSYIELEPERRQVMLYQLGLFARNLGDLIKARAAFEHCVFIISFSKNVLDKVVEAGWAEEIVFAYYLSGKFSLAMQHSETAVSLAQRTKHLAELEEDGTNFTYNIAKWIWHSGLEDVTVRAFALRAVSHFAVGDLAAAVADFDRAAEVKGAPIGVIEAESAYIRGERSLALARTQASRESAVKEKNNHDLCLCNAMLARFLLPQDPAKAAEHLLEARTFANQSGILEFQLRCYHAACKLELCCGNHPQAIAEAEAGILLADTCGFGAYSIDLRIVLAETLLAAGIGSDGAQKALQSAREALSRSEHCDCKYAWGRADSLHFYGLAQLQLGEREKARQALLEAVELRQRLSHRRIEETQRALEMCL